MAGLDKYTKVLLHFDESITKDECKNEWITYNTIGSESPSNPILTEFNAKFGKAILFDGTYRMITTKDFIPFGTENFTIDFWVYMDSNTSTWGHIFEFNDSTAYTPEIFRFEMTRNNGGNDAKIYGYNRSENQTDFLSTGDILEKLVHIAITYEYSTKKLSLFVDGKKKGTIIYTIDEGTYRLRLGNGIMDWSTYFSGTIDEFRYSSGIIRWKSNFTPPEKIYSESKLMTIMNGEIYIITSDIITSDIYSEYLIVHLPFDTSTTEDLCGNTWTAYGSPDVSNKYLNLPSGSYLINNSVTIGGQDFTINGWCYYNSSSGQWSRIFEAAQTDTSGTNIIFFGRYNSNSSFLIAPNDSYASFSWTTNQWFHFEVVHQYSSSTTKVYINGTLAVTKTGQAMTRVARKLRIGKSSWSSDGAFIGMIDDFKIYDGIALHTENFTPPTRSSGGGGSNQ